MNVPLDICYDVTRLLQRRVRRFERVDLRLSRHLHILIFSRLGRSYHLDSVLCVSNSTFLMRAALLIVGGFAIARLD